MVLQDDIEEPLGERTISLRRTITLALLLCWGNLVTAETLIEIYHLAQLGDPQLRSAEAAYIASTESRRQSLGGLLPSITLNANATRTRQDTTVAADSFVSAGKQSFTSKGYTLSLNQPIYRQELLSQLHQGDALIEQAEALFRAAQQDLLLRVAQAYFNLLAARDNLDFIQAEKRAIKRQLEQTKQRFEVGLIAITDVHEAQAAYDLTGADEIAAQNQLQINRQALREITGQLHKKLQPLGEITLLLPQPNNMEEWTERALQQNFLIIAAQAAVTTQQQQLAQQRGNRHPNIDLVLSHSYSDLGGGNFGGRETNDNSISLQFSLPIYQGGGVSAGIRKGQQQLIQEQEALEQQRRSIQRGTSDAFLSVVAGISRVKALQQAVISSQSALDATEAGFEVGNRTTVDVLNVRRELFRTQRDHARAHYDYILASLRLKQTAGILQEEDLQQINNWLAKP